MYMRYGRLIILSFGRKGKYKTAVCKCDCGSTKEVYLSNLNSGKTKSCGCLEQENRKKFKDISGKKFNCITSLVPTINRDNAGNIIWKCRCDCGNVCKVSHGNLVTNHTRSCGCLKKIEYRTKIDGTVVECLVSKLYSNNTSGFKSVSKVNSKWISYINFSNKRYTLGRYDTLQEAKQERRRAEKKMFDPIIKKLAVISEE